MIWIEFLVVEAVLNFSCIITEEKQLFDKNFEEENEAANVTEVSKFEALQDLEAEAMQVCGFVFVFVYA